MIKFKYFWLRNHHQIEFLSGDKFFWPIWPNPTFLPIFGLFWLLWIRKWANPPFLSLNIHFASKQNGFFKKEPKNLGKSVIWPTWPNVASIWPNLAFRRLGLALHGFLFTNMYRPTLWWGQKKFQKFYRNSGWFFSVIEC